MDVEKLLLRINSGTTLDPGEIEEVAALLEWTLQDGGFKEKVSEDEIYSLILVIGRARATKFRHIIAQFLESEDPLTVSLVIDILCLEWGGTREYLERLIHFALGVAWDVDNDVQQAALRVLGEFVSGERGATNGELSPGVLRVIELLFSIFEDEHVEEWSRRSAYFALLRAAGRKRSELPSECLVLNLEPGSSDILWDDLEALKALVH